MFVCVLGVGVWMGVGRPCPHVRNDIVTQRHLLFLIMCTQMQFMWLHACMFTVSIYRSSNHQIIRSYFLRSQALHSAQPHTTTFLPMAWVQPSKIDWWSWSMIFTALEWISVVVSLTLAKTCRRLHCQSSKSSVVHLWRDDPIGNSLNTHQWRRTYSASSGEAKFMSVLKRVRHHMYGEYNLMDEEHRI